jgi:hypothetical protein
MAFAERLNASAKSALQPESGTTWLPFEVSKSAGTDPPDGQPVTQVLRVNGVRPCMCRVHAHSRSNVDPDAPTIARCRVTQQATPVFRVVATACVVMVGALSATVRAQTVAGWLY